MNIELFNIDDLTPEALPKNLARIFGLGEYGEKILQKVAEKKAFKRNIEILMKSPHTTEKELVTKADFKANNSFKKALSKMKEMGFINERYASIRDINTNKRRVIKFFYVPYDSFYDLWLAKKNEINMRIENYTNYFRELEGKRTGT
ncbi:MAG: hypothetical protein ACP5KL_05960 [Thermoplasmata archaeon]|jgi:HD superfamily phosphohydrolase